MRTIWLAVLLGALGLVACADSIYGTSGNTYDDKAWVLAACGAKTCGASNGVTCGMCTGLDYYDTAVNQCKAACINMTCGTDHGIECGTCTGENYYCNGRQCVHVTQGMVTVPGGTLTLGASDISDNKPHSSTVATFQMDLTEVTVAA
ncbi:MAG: hypothetical protein WCI05_13700 [Myxococcales bacterium]